MPRILVTRRLPSSAIALLRTAGQVEIAEHDLDRTALLERVAGRDALVCVVTDRIDQTVLEAAGSALKIVANIAVGYDNIDIPSARSRGVIVTNTPDVLTGAVAEFAWALILALTRRLSEGERVIRRGEWKGWAFDFLLGSELHGKRIGIVGAGRIGQAVAARAVAFGVRPVFADVSPPAGLEGILSLDELLRTSDIVTLHVPLTPETRHLIDRKALTRMKRSAYLINTARGPIVDEAALAWALRERLIAGAALDVYEHEPEVSAELLALENVLLAPHLGSATSETRTAMAELAAKNVAAVLSGRPPLTEVRIA